MPPPAAQPKRKRSPSHSVSQDDGWEVMWIPEPVVFPASSSGKATSKGGKRTAEESNEEDGLVIKKPKTPPPIDAQPWSDEDIKENSRRFTLTEQLWVHPDIWELEMDPDYKEEDRFSVDSFRYQGMLRELQSVIPDSIRGDRELGSFQLEWKQHTASIRSASAAKVRTKHAEAIFGEDVTSLDAEERSTRFRERIGFDKATTSYNPFAPILYSKDEHSPETIFRSKVLLKVACTILFNHPLAGSSPVGPKTYGMKWGLKEVTPGLIACAAVLARWALSGDTSCEMIGSQTNINWTKDFSEYKEYLLVGFAENAPSVLALFKYWNRKLFPTPERRRRESFKEERPSEGLKAALQQLREDGAGNEEQEAEEEPEEPPKKKQKAAPQKLRAGGATNEQQEDEEEQPAEPSRKKQKATPQERRASGTAGEQREEEGEPEQPPKKKRKTSMAIKVKKEAKERRRR